ncbi:MAG: DUF952 domain-containing protein [Parachlamydiales bacterium]|nr:DUF952 domain-containing protein [Parachlamydiales bacterium]
MKNWLTIAFLCIVSFSLAGNEKPASTKEIILEETNQSPQYLYKILSLRNWQATQSRKNIQLSAKDDSFIHCSAQDQLERIIEKYWADAAQLVVLKIDSNKLEGRLVFETNPGGTTKYYHLYDGFIPFHSIVESKIIYQKLNERLIDQSLNQVKVNN